MRKVLILAVALLAAVAAAGKGKGGGGGGGGIADADVSILYYNASDSMLYKGDDAGRVEKALAFPITPRSSFGPAGSTRLAIVDVDGLGIYVTDDFAGGGLTKVVGFPEHGFGGFPGRVAPAWSNGNAPNGEQMIAFCEQTPASSIRYHLYVTTLSGEVTQLTYDSGQSRFDPSWNPVTNDEIVVAGTGSAGPHNLWLLDLGVNSAGELYVASEVDLLAGTSLEGVRVENPSFSPDGTRIVFNALTGSNGTNGLFEVWVYETASGTLRNLTPANMRAADAHHPCIREDGRVMFSYPDSTPGSGASSVLWVMEADGSNVRIYGNSKKAHDQRLVESRR